MATEQRRAYPRIRCEVPIVFSTDEFKTRRAATMRNYCEGGFYFESPEPLSEGTCISVKTNEDSVLDPLGAGTWNVRKAEIRWCRELDSDHHLLYGYGVAYLNNHHSS